MSTAQLASLEEFSWLTALEQERFVRALEGSLKVRSRSQFFLWVQGAVHGLLPHSMLICACGAASEFSVIERFSDRPLPEEEFEQMCWGSKGLLAQAIQWWREGAAEPRLVCDAYGDGHGLEATLARYKLPNLAAHGTLDLKDNITSFFTFGGIPGPLNHRHRHMLELLVPYLHTTLLRVVQNERTVRASAPALKHVLTVREIEILRWVQQGKSNAAIGNVLGISPLTVKNHVQNVLRKLNVQNRAQAVAKGHSLRILDFSSAP